MKEGLRRFWEGWKRFGQVVGDFVAHIVLTLLYFTIFLPVGLLMRLFSDRLDVKDAGDKVSNWLDRSTQDSTIDEARRLS